MRRVTVLVLACLALLVLSATGGAAERSLQTHSDDDLQWSAFAELSSESELEAEVEAEVDAQVESESEAADSATLAEIDPEEHAKLQAVLASWPADQLVPLVGQQLSDDEPIALVESQAESHAAAQAETEAAVEAEVDAELAAEAAAEAEADAAAESEVDAELMLLEKAEAAALLFSSDAPVDINAQSADEVAPVMESRPQPHMVMVPAVSAAGPPSIRARADAAVEEQEDRALLALEAAVYANGCGSGWQSKVVPQWNMAPACNKHDNCYEESADPDTAPPRSASARPKAGSELEGAPDASNIACSCTQLLAISAVRISI